MSCKIVFYVFFNELVFLSRPNRTFPKRAERTPKESTSSLGTPPFKGPERNICRRQLRLILEIKARQRRAQKYMLNLMLIWWAWWRYDFLNSRANIPMRWCKWRSLERTERRGSKIQWKNQSWAAFGRPPKTTSSCNEGGLRPPAIYKRFQWETKGGYGE